ncbi:hypothetical protein FRC14_000300, partial [Serendipita sp. 396]
MRTPPDPPDPLPPHFASVLISLTAHNWILRLLRNISIGVVHATHPVRTFFHAPAFR